MIKLSLSPDPFMLTDDLERLNTDTSKINKDLYSSSTGTKVDATLDTRLLTEDGRNQIKEDAKIASKIIDTVEKIATLDDVGIQDFFKQTGQSVDQYNAYKKLLMENPQLAEKLQDSNLSLEEKQIYANQMLKALENELGYSLANGVKVISTDETGANGTQVKGYISLENDTIYSNDKNQTSTKDTIFALGQEFTGAIQNANGIDITQNRDVHNEYQNVIAKDTVDDISFVMSNYYNSSMSNTNNHNTGLVTQMQSVFNRDNSLISNNSEFASLDKSKGDDSISKIVVNMNEYKNKTNYGTALVYVDGESNPREIKITSGRNTSDYTKSNAGPTPPGAYLIDPNKSQNMSVNDRIDGINQSTNELSLFNFIKKYSDDWGIFRVPLEPANSTNTYNRTGMYIHGGTFDGSIGCIDCGNNDKWLFGEVRDTKKFIPVEIKYDENYKK